MGSDSVIVCLQCGDQGAPNALVYCVDCLECAVHRYCLDIIPETLDEYVRWFCDDCETKPRNQLILRRFEAENVPRKAKKRRHEESNTLQLQGDSAEIDSTETCQLTGNCSAETDLNKKSLVASLEVREVHGQAKKRRHEESMSLQLQGDVAKIESNETSQSMGNCTAEMDLDKKSLATSLEVQEVHEQEKCNATPLVVMEDGQRQLSSSFGQPIGGYERAQPVIDIIWQGCFQICNKDYEILDALVAHLSVKASERVYMEASSFPPMLKLEMLPKSVIWPKSFQTSDPTDENIALYFFPANNKFERRFDCLVDTLMREELAMRAILSNAELLIFTSQELPPLYWRFNEKYYLWGVFRGKQQPSEQTPKVLNLPRLEPQSLKTLRVSFYSAAKDEVTIHTIRLPNESTVRDILRDLKKKVALSNPKAELRLLSVSSNKIYKMFPPHKRIKNITDHNLTLRAEEIPKEQINLSPHVRLIHVCHFTKDTAQNQGHVRNFGEPFFIVIHEGETLADVKPRIQKKLHIPNEEFSKWKFASVLFGSIKYLRDSSIFDSRFMKKDIYAPWDERYLGLEHMEQADESRAVYSEPNDSMSAAKDDDYPQLLSPYITDRIIKSLSKEQLVLILRNAMLQHHDILESVRDIADLESTRRKVLVDGLNKETTSEKLHEVFSRYGELKVTECRKRKRQGVVVFKHVDGAVMALKEPNKEIDGHITVTHPAPKAEHPQSQSANVDLRKIIVANVPVDMPLGRLSSFFSCYGEIEKGPFGVFSRGGKDKGIAILVYKSKEAARAALREKSKTIDGHRVVCRLESKNKQQQLKQQKQQLKQQKQQQKQQKKFKPNTRHM